MASKRRLRRKQCDGKEQYNSENAHTEASRRFGISGAFIRAYRCSFGNHWHIGHYKAGTHRTSSGV